VNPNDRSAVAATLHEALIMPLEERRQRIHHLQSRLKEYTIIDWAKDFMRELDTHTSAATAQHIATITPKVEKEIVGKFQEAATRLLLLDYDGTLSAYASRPEQAKPDAALRRLLKRLSQQRGTEVVIISGRTRKTMDEWFGDLPISLVAEHGACTRAKGKVWHCKPQRETDWKSEVMELWAPLEQRTPGGFIEQKEYSLVWHYRRVPTALAKLRLQQLMSITGPLAENLDLGIYQGQKMLEIRQHDNSKAVPTEGWLQRKDWQFILAAGDDYTDEDIFRILPDDAYAIKVGTGSTAAHYRTQNSETVLALLKKLAAKPRNST